jgi:hypothetical protein
MRFAASQKQVQHRPAKWAKESVTRPGTGVTSALCVDQRRTKTAPHLEFCCLSPIAAFVMLLPDFRRTMKINVNTR